jgi:hypothetical protein
METDAISVIWISKKIHNETLIIFTNAHARYFKEFVIKYIFILKSSRYISFVEFTSPYEWACAVLSRYV